MKLKEFWHKHKNDWLGTIFYILLGFVLAYAFYYGLGFVLNTGTPVVAVFSESMVPTFYKGDMIVVSGSDKFSVGDIIVFQTTERSYPIIHRINNITEEGIRTKGDNNQYVDPWIVKESGIYGKAVFRIPLLGWVKIMFSELTGMA